MYICKDCNKLFQNDMDFNSMDHDCIVKYMQMPMQELLRCMEANGSCTPEFAKYERAAMRQQIRLVK